MITEGNYDPDKLFMLSFFPDIKKLVESLNLTKNGNNEEYEYMAEKDTLKRLVLRLNNKLQLYCRT